MHARQQLRDAIVTAVTGLATTGARVYTARVYPAQDTELPHLEVNTVDEEAQPVSLHGPGLVERIVSIEITARARATSVLAGTLDDIAEQVETALSGAITVSSKSVPLSYQGASIQFSGDADQPIGAATLRYQATLYTASNAPGTLVNG
jgi:hypothetical protein